MVNHHPLCSAHEIPGTAQFHPEVIDEPSGPRPSYRMVPGPEQRQWAFRIAERAGIPPAVLATARGLLKGS